MEMKSRLISDYYKHEQDQLERSGYSNVYETYRNSMLVCHLLHLIQHFRVTGMDCLPRLLFIGYRHLYLGGKVAGAWSWPLNPVYCTFVHGVPKDKFTLPLPLSFTMNFQHVIIVNGTIIL